MRFSRWQAQGNVYLVADEPLTADDVRAQVAQADPAELPRIGPALETDSRFPERTNVQVARRVDDETIEARVWERGVGETQSSGTSAVAVAAAFGAKDVKVRFPGGDLHVRLDGELAYLTGTAELSSGVTPEP